MPINEQWYAVHAFINLYLNIERNLTQKLQVSDLHATQVTRAPLVAHQRSLVVSNLRRLINCNPELFVERQNIIPHILETESWWKRKIQIPEQVVDIIDEEPKSLKLLQPKLLNKETSSASSTQSSPVLNVGTSRRFRICKQIVQEDIPFPKSSPLPGLIHGRDNSMDSSSHEVSEATSRGSPLTLLDEDSDEAMIEPSRPMVRFSLARVRSISSEKSVSPSPWPCQSPTERERESSVNSNDGISSLPKIKILLKPSTPPA
jgi:hypothetical protein